MDTSDESPTHWRGVPMAEIHRNLNEFELEHVPPVVPSDCHTVLHHYPIKEPLDEPPRPLRQMGKWDALHVRMPCSSKSQYPVTAADGTSSIESRWQMIEEAFTRPITNSRELQAAILSYNSKYEGKWNFRALHRLFEQELDESEAQVFFEDLLPRIVRLALRLPQIVAAPIPLLKQHTNRSLTLTQEQIASLLANAFLCTFPRRNTLKNKSEYSSFPDINFNRLFDSHPEQSVLEKLKCLCHYFRRVCPTQRNSSNVPTGVVTFTRHSIPAAELPDWEHVDTPLGSVKWHITAEGTIEDEGCGLLQVDFANKYIGGGVLGHGCVQEEIRFVICPELMVAKLFTECLRPNEALLMVGCERYSNYTGYAGSFQWAGNHEDTTPRDSSRRRLTHLVAIDALAFQQAEHQYRTQLMQRELNKAYVGFRHQLDTPAPGVASGNWGCGAFRGDATLKALLQLMVCAKVGRPLAYFTFGNDELCDQLADMYKFLDEHEVTVAELWQTLAKFESQRLAPKELYNFLYSCLGERDDQKHSLINRVVKRIQAAVVKMTAAQATAAAAAVAATAVAVAATAAVTTPLPITNGSDSDAPKPTQPEAEAVAPLNVSEDIFAVDSDSDDAAVEAVPSAAAAVSPAEKRPPGVEAEATRRSPRSASSPTSRDCTPKAGPRQRTLLEMLDQCYTNEPATKRHCASQPFAKAKSKASPS